MHIGQTIPLESTHLVIGGGAFVSDFLTDTLREVPKAFILRLLSGLSGAVVAVPSSLWVDIVVKGQPSLSTG